MLPTNIWISLLTVVVIINTASSLDNGLALTPPMGWLSWERFRCITDCVTFPDTCISERLYMEMADRLAGDGYKEAGYKYLILDDCWMAKSRDENGRLQPDPDRFPNGIGFLADYIHSLGLKFGIYEDYGNLTCGGYPGILGHLEIDALTFAEWGADYIKLDGCYANPADMDDGYPAFGRLLNATGRPIVYSCSWPVYQEYAGIPPNFTKIEENCNLWRNWNDIDDSWDSVTSIIDYFALNQDRIIPHAGPGHFNDPDMLIIGNFGLSYEESKAQMAIWAMLAAPLIMSNDLRDVSEEAKSILLEPRVISINQDPLGIQGRRASVINGVEYWVRPILPMKGDEYSYALAFLNRRTDGTPHQITVTLEELNMKNPEGYELMPVFGENATIILQQNEHLSFLINPSGVEMFRANII